MAAVLPHDRLATPGIPDSPLAAMMPSDLGEGPLDVTEGQDGTAEVQLPQEPEEEGHDFYANLAESGIIPEAELATIALDLSRKFETDKQAREARDRQYAEAIKRSGLGNEAPGGADFDGAARVAHPMISKACVDFAAGAMRELFPPDGPCRQEIKGEPTPEKQKLAEKQREGMNWALTEWMPEYADDLEQIMTQLPLGGSQFQKFYWDPRLGRLTSEFVPVDNLILPFSATSFFSAERRTHVQELTELEYKDRIEAGFYRDLDLSPPALIPDQTDAAQAAAKVEGKDSPTINEDGIRNAWELDVLYELSIDGDVTRPYLITIDEQSKRVLSIYRNWEEKDKRAKRLDWIVEYGFIFWRGAYKIGLQQLIGGLSAAATGALRALLDSAHVNNVPTAAILKGAKIGGQTKELGVCQLTEIESTIGNDDIRKIMAALPFNPPSQVLAWLLGWLTEQAQAVVTTAEERIADAGNNMPVGTALALIETGAKVTRSIHARLHRSQRHALKIIKRILGDHAEEFQEAQQDEMGEVLLGAKELRAPMAIAPVSDPNIFSEGQRYAQAQMLLQLAISGKQVGVSFNLDAVYRRILRTAKIPNIEEVLPEQKGPQELNAAAENVAAFMGQPVVAFPDQDHLAHLETHIRFAMDPMLGGSPAAQPVFLPRILENIKQHVAFYYAKQMHDLTGQALEADPSELFRQEGGSAKADQLIAAASKVVHARVDKTLEALGPSLEQLLQVVQEMKPEAPLDPTEAALAETARRAQRDVRELDLREKDDKADQALEGLGLKIKAQGQDSKTMVDLTKIRAQRIKDRQAAYGRLPGNRGE